ncbi:putative kinesin-related protein KLPA [Drechmeria coniospora]|uniref:Kinesin-like protein n=1 Tax=Drechmeria coniospora TaxID=98403 RepID=A0A151GJ43_DRECN|nr:putative kinesin-related protein KLPA [Drechmeria coniospora]KYK57143.1 putative kinesin-related protein KLPA [Drechmeria coniospora]
MTSRLPALAARAGSSLAECSDSQSNARTQSSIPAPPDSKPSNLKRAIAPSTLQPDAKRKHLSEQAAHYPAKSSSLPTVNPARSSIRGQTLSAISQLKQQQPSRSRGQSTVASNINNFAKSIGPGRSIDLGRSTAAPSTSGVRAPNSRTKSQTPRPRTVQGHREEHVGDTSIGSGMAYLPEISSSRKTALEPFQAPQVEERNDQRCLSCTSESSLTTGTKLAWGVDGPLFETRQVTTELRPQGGIDRSSWDVDGRVDVVESQIKKLKDMVESTVMQRRDEEDAFQSVKSRSKSDGDRPRFMSLMREVVSELENERKKLEERNEQLEKELDAIKEERRELHHEMEKQQWNQTRNMDDLERRHQDRVEELSRQHRMTVEDLSRELDQLRDQQSKEHRQQMDALLRQHQQQLEEERQKKDGEIQDIRQRMSFELQDLDVVMQRKEREAQDIKSQLENLRADMDRENLLRGSLQAKISELSAANMTLEAKINSLKSHVEFLESDSKAQSDSFSNMEKRLQDALFAADEARRKLMKEETERRVLFNKYQELKGNIRVMCRVRPVLGDGEGEEARVSFPDDKTSAEIVLAGPEERSSLGQVSRKNYPFEFDRVFTPNTPNEDIFGEISQLVQSALDGYNVCIFCYGQTGSGKTYTMSSEDGMIPRATHMIYDTMTELREKSWEYTMEGSFVEVYNEELNDLLTPHDRSSPEGKAKKLEIRHDEVRKQTSIVNCRSVQLNSAASVEKMLEQAQSNRSVAATKANERSSRSHSVFVLKLVGENSATGERCEGTLNLVDLAGSERLKHSQAEGERMKETQSINKSLSCLGDVIEALGRGSGHVPYRNSKLTHLLQYSLGGNSKTLMFVMVSPLEVHLKETLTSLRFATKVHNTHIGTAKATKKTKGAE